ncbi:MAG: hypothetical protein ACYC0V_12825 [Armatimonadota bacterium]
MKKNGTELADWAVRKIETEYKDDVCLLLEHNTLRLEEDRDGVDFSYYIPATNRANCLARTFIVDGIGYDLFPMSWERIEDIAELNEVITTCLADAEILFARSEVDRQRFGSLQARLVANLQNPHMMYKKALAWFNTAMDMYQEILFEESICKVRENAGHICNLLALSIACINGKYFKHGQTDQISEILSMNDIPVRFVDLYEQIIYTKMIDEQKRLCHDIISVMKKFLDDHNTDAVPAVVNPDAAGLAAWYQELSYTWRRVYHWCNADSPINAYLWCCLLQNEVNRVGAENGIDDLDILSYFDADNLSAFRKRAEYMEQKIIDFIEANGVTIDSYPSVEAFLEKNR